MIKASIVLGISFNAAAGYVFSSFSRESAMKAALLENNSWIKVFTGINYSSMT